MCIDRWAHPLHHRSMSKKSTNIPKVGGPSHPHTFLQQWRKARGLSQEALGEKAGYSQGMISQWENGGNIDLTHIEELARALEITSKQLLYRDPSLPETIEDVFDALPPGRQEDVLEIARSLRDRSRSE